MAPGVKSAVYDFLVSLCRLFRSGYGSEPAAGNACSGDADLYTAAADRVVTSARHRPVSAAADDDVEPSRTQSGVSAHGRVDP